MDPLTTEQRSARMRLVKSKDTGPERAAKLKWELLLSAVAIVSLPASDVLGDEDSIRVSVHVSPATVTQYEPVLLAFSITSISEKGTFVTVPSQRLEVWIRHEGKPFRKIERSVAFKHKKYRRHPLETGQKAIGLVLAFVDDSQAGVPGFLFAVPGEYELKVAYEGVDSDAISIKVTPDEGNLPFAERLFRAGLPEWLPVAGDPGIILASETASALDNYVQENPVPPFIDCVRCILSRTRVDASALATPGLVLKARQCRAISQNAGLLRAAAAEKLSRLRDRGAVKSAEFKALSDEFIKHRSDLVWVLDPQLDFNEHMYNLLRWAPSSFDESALDQHVSWLGGSLGSWCKTMYDQTGVNLTHDDSISKHRHVIPISSRETLRAAMTTLGERTHDSTHYWKATNGGYRFVKVDFGE